MDDRRWQLAKNMFSKALTVPPQGRAAWVESECDDAEVRVELLELLAAHDDNGSDAAPPPATPPVTPPATPPAEGPGSVIDRYKLLQQIGEGGFGTVYMAAQSEPVERRVALKIIKPGMDCGQVVARFEAERQALALMDHPNIARVFDAGTTDSGRPYFVMELVKGIPITEYCDQQQLGPRERLQLFIQVCHGVQHAHQKGIIHRDLKPSNVLVAEYDHIAVPKIIDFGVAKATSHQLTEKTVFTEFGQLVGTFEYMSPEQAKLNQLDIDTRSDVYSLGVLMYQLLTGTTPIARERLRSAAFEELLRIIREEEPPRPSTRVSTLATAGAAGAARPGDPRKLSRLLRGELDWIVMRALDKERNRRYESVGSLADDVNRYLAGQVVVAGPPSTAYRLRKFVRRHRGSVAAAVALALTLVLGLAGTSLGVVHAREAERDAVAAQRDAEAAREVERSLRFRMAVDKGLHLCDDGRVSRGMLWLARALEIAPAGETAMRRAVRENLNAWRRKLNSLEMIYPHAEPVICVAFDPSGNVLATGCNDGTAQLWDVRTGVRIGAPMQHGGDVHQVAFSTDGSRLLTTALDGSAFIWDTRTGQRLAALSRDATALGGCLGGAFRQPDDHQVVTSYGDGDVVVWDAETGAAVGGPEERPTMVHQVTVSADGSRLLTACHDGTAQLWDLDSFALLATFSHGSCSRVTSADFLGADESQVVTGDGDGGVYLWNVADALEQPDRTLEVPAAEFVAAWRHGGNVHRLAADRKRRRILTAAFDNTARLLTPGDDGGGTVIEHLAAVQATALHPDGARAATACEDGALRLWRPGAGLAVRRATFPIGAQEAVYSADGGYVLTKPDAETALLSDARDGAPICRLHRPGGIRAVAVSADGALVLTGGADGTSRLWDTRTGHELQEYRRPGNDIWSVAFSPDGTRTLVGGFDGALEVRDVRTGELVGERHPFGARVQGIATSPDGTRIAVACDDRVLRIVDDGDWARARRLYGHRGTATVVAFSADGTRLVSGSFDNTVRVWDAATGAALGEPLPHEGPIAYVATAFRRDGRVVASGCEAGTARLWDVDASQPIGPALRHDSGVRMVAFRGDAQVVTGTAAGTVGVWDVATTPLEGDTERITLWVQVATGFELDADDRLVALDADGWQLRRDRLAALGGPPTAE